MKKFIFTIFAICLSTPSFADYDPARCFPFTPKPLPQVSDDGQYIESNISSLQSPAYLQCGGTAKNNAQCKDEDTVAGKKGYIYKCTNQNWVKLSNDTDIKSCVGKESRELVGYDEELFPKGESFIYLINQFPGARLSNFCYYPLEKYNKYKEDCEKDGGHFIKLGLCEKSSNQSNTIQPSNSPLTEVPYGESILTCATKKTTSLNACNTNQIVSSSNGNLYKCTQTGWEKFSGDDIEECTAPIEKLEEEHRFDASTVWATYKKAEIPAWIYFYEDASERGCNPAIKIHCKYSTKTYKNQEAECEKQGGDFLIYGQNNDKDIFYKCYTANVEKKEITVTNDKKQPLSDVTVIYRGNTEYITDRNGQVILPMVKGRKLYNVTFKQDNFITQTIPENNVYSNPTIILYESSKKATADEQPTITNTDSQKNCTDTGGTGLDENGKCICDPDKHLVEYKYEDKYSICRCMDGYHRVGGPDKNGKYAATGKCVYAPEIKTQIKRDDMAMQRDAEDAYRNEYDNAQSWANKGTTALSTLATGEGAMMAARAIAEKIADDDAEEKMAEYVSTMKCEYGGGQSVNLGDTETLPGGNELANYYAEYKQLADKLKATKAALNLRPGIEAEVLYDRAETGLYQYQTAERQSGGFTSLSRALMNPDGTDAEQWNAQRAETNQNLLVGGALATVGLVGSYVANRAINKDHVKKYKELEEKFREIKTMIERRYPEAFIFTEPEIQQQESPTITETVVQESEPSVTVTPQLPKLNPFKDNYLFDSGKWVLKSTHSALDEYITYIVDTFKDEKYLNSKICINVDGYTDWIPPKPGFVSNKVLSERRAQAVSDYIKTKTGDISNHIRNITPTGHGDEQCNKAIYKTEEELQTCRRVEINIRDCSDL